MRAYAEKWVRDIVEEIEKINWCEFYYPFYRLKYHDLVIEGSDYYIIDRTLHNVFYIELRYTYERKYRLIPNFKEHSYESYFNALGLFLDEIKGLLNHEILES